MAEMGRKAREITGNQRYDFSNQPKGVLQMPKMRRFAPMERIFQRKFATIHLACSSRPPKKNI